MIVVALPHHDIPTTISAHAAFDLISWLREEGFEIRNLYSWKAVRPLLWGSLTRPTKLVCYYGHGSEIRLHGQIPPNFLVDAENVNWLEGKVVFTYACLSARNLGKRAIERGVVTYFGSDEYMYVAFPEFDHDYLADLIDCINTIPKELIKGASAESAYRAYKEKTLSYVELYENRKADWPNADWYAMAFRRNAEFYRLLGNPDARLDHIEPTVVKIPLYDPLDVLAVLGIFVAPVAGAGMKILYDYGKRKKWW